ESKDICDISFIPAALAFRLETSAQFRLMLVQHYSGCSMATPLKAERERELWASYCRLFIGIVPRRKTASISGGSQSNPTCRRSHRQVSRPSGFRPQTRRQAGNRWG